MKRVLIITYYWPPSSGSGVQRWLKFSKYLPEYGWQPVIYTPSNPDTEISDSTLEKDIPTEAEILKRRITEPYSVFRLFFSAGKSGTKPESKTSPETQAVPANSRSSATTGASSSSSSVNSNNANNSSRSRNSDSASSSNITTGPTSAPTSAVNPINAVGKKSFVMKLSLWIRANIFVPDPRCLWVRPSVRFLEKYLEEHPVDAIVSTGPPHSMHLIARQLHRKTGVRWIADFRDPWTKIFYFKHLPMLNSVAKKHIRLEKSILCEADAVVSVTDLITQQLEAAITLQNNDSYARSNDALPTSVTNRFHTIENGYDETDFQTEVTQDSHFTLTHTGVFSVEGNPDTLWKVLGDLCRESSDFRNNLRIVLAGKTDREVLEDIDKNGLTEAVTNHGYVKHSDSNRLQQEAHILLLPLRKEPEADGILTGKYFEYLAAGRPIAAFGPKGGALDQSLQKTHAGQIFGWNEYTSLRSYILDIYSAYLLSQSSSGSKPDLPKEIADCKSGFRQSEAMQSDISDNTYNRNPHVFHPNPEEILKYSRHSLTAHMAALLNSTTD